MSLVFTKKVERFKHWVVAKQGERVGVPDEVGSSSLSLATKTELYMVERIKSRKGVGQKPKYRSRFFGEEAN